MLWSYTLHISTVLEKIAVDYSITIRKTQSDCGKAYLWQHGHSQDRQVRTWLSAQFHTRVPALLAIIVTSQTRSLPLSRYDTNAQMIYP